MILKPHHFAPAGILADCRSCPVALAIQKQLKDGYYVEVFVGTFRIWKSGTTQVAYAAQLPRILENWINTYDQKYTADPLEVDLDIPEQLCIPQESTLLVSI